MPRYACLEAPDRPIVLREAAGRRLEPGAARARTLLSEVCGTDVHLLHGKLAGVPYPIIPGHVSVAELTELNGEVRDVDGNLLRPGDRITFYDVFGTCGRCWHCAVARTSTRCPHRRVYGITLPASEGFYGGWSQEIHLLPGVQILRLPETVSTEEFMGGGCGLPTSFHAVERSGIRMADTVYVQGSGPVGLSSAIFAQLAGARQVLVSGAAERRLRLAQDLGAEAVFDIRTTSPVERVARVRELTSGRGADVVIEASGNPHAVPEGLEAVRDGGVYTIVGQYTDHGEVSINPHLHLNRKHVDVRGCWGYEFTHLYRSLQMMERYNSRFRWSRFISKVYGLEGVNEALQAVAGLEVVKAVIDPWMP